MRTLSEVSEEWWALWLKEQQAIMQPMMEKIIRDKLDLDERFEIVWDPTIPDTKAHVVILPTKEMKKKYPRSR